MKKLVFFLFIMIFSILQSHNVFSQGKIGKVEEGDLFTITVKGYASKDLWLGCTINPDTYNEIDLQPQKVPKGNFAIKLDLSTGAVSSLMQGNTSIPYVVALWEEKISLRECEKRYGEGSEHCKWARKNKYQMEGRIDRYSGSYTP